MATLRRHLADAAAAATSSNLPSAKTAAATVAKGSVNFGKGAATGVSNAISGGTWQNSFARLVSIIPGMPSPLATPQPLSVYSLVKLLVPWTIYVVYSGASLVLGIFAAFYTISLFADWIGICLAGCVTDPLMACTGNYCARPFLRSKKKTLEAAASDGAAFRYWLLSVFWWIIGSPVQILFGIFEFAGRLLMNAGTLVPLLVVIGLAATLADNYVWAFDTLDFIVDAGGSLWNFVGGFYNIARALSFVFLIPLNLNTYYTWELYRFFSLTYGAAIFNSGGAAVDPGQLVVSFFSGTDPELTNLGNTFGRRLGDVVATASPTSPFATDSSTPYDAGPDITEIVTALSIGIRLYATVLEVLYSVTFLILKIILIILLPAISYIATAVLGLMSVLACALPSPQCTLLEGVQSIATFFVALINSNVLDPINSVIPGSNLQIANPSVACSAADFGSGVPCNCASQNSGIYTNLPACGAITYACEFNPDTNEYTEIQTQNGVQTTLGTYTSQPQVCQHSGRVLSHESALALLETHDHIGCYFACVNGTKFEACPLEGPELIWHGECDHAPVAAGRRRIAEAVPYHKSEAYLRDTFGSRADFVTVTTRGGASTSAAAAPQRANKNKMHDSGGVTETIRSMIGGRTTVSDEAYTCDLAQTGDFVDEYVRGTCVSHLLAAEAVRKVSTHSNFGKSIRQAVASGSSGSAGRRLDAAAAAAADAKSRAHARKQATVLVRLVEFVAVRAARITKSSPATRRSLLSEAWSAKDSKHVARELKDSFGISLVAPYAHFYGVLASRLTESIVKFDEHVSAEKRRQERRKTLTKPPVIFGGAGSGRHLAAVSTSPTTVPTSKNKIGLFANSQCPESYTCPDGKTCVADKKNCPEPIYWSVDVSFKWALLQAQLVCEAQSIPTIWSAINTCWREIDQNPAINPVAMQNIGKDPQVETSLRYCLPMIAALPLPAAKATELDFRALVGEWCSTGIPGSTVEPCTCPQYISVGILESDYIWFFNVPYYVYAMVFNACQVFWYFFTLIFTRDGPIDEWWHWMTQPFVGDYSFPAWLPYLFGDQNQPGSTGQQLFCASINSYALFALVWLIIVFVILFRTLMKRAFIVLYEFAGLLVFPFDKLMEFIYFRLIHRANREKAERQIIAAAAQRRKNFEYLRDLSAKRFGTILPMDNAAAIAANKREIARLIEELDRFRKEMNAVRKTE